jgi:hypothetical protein
MCLPRSLPLLLCKKKAGNRDLAFAERQLDD